MRIKKKSLARLASISAVGAGALATRSAHAAVIYTNFSPPLHAVGASAASSFSVAQVANAGIGGFGLFTTGSSSIHPGTLQSTRTSILKIALQGLNGLKFQSAPGVGFIWRTTQPTFSSKVLRSKKFTTTVNFSIRKYTPLTNGKASTTTQRVLTGINFTSKVLLDRLGDFYMLFQFNPTGSQTLYGWLHLYGACNCGLDTIAVDMAYEDSGALIAVGQSPEPATAIPTGFAALALGATGVRRWRKSRRQAA